MKKIRTLAEQQGRSANDIKVFVGITVVVAETHDLAVQNLMNIVSMQVLKQA